MKQQTGVLTALTEHNEEGDKRNESGASLSEATEMRHDKEDGKNN